MSTFDYKEYSKVLLKDKKLAKVINTVGPCPLEVPKKVSLFTRLARTIAYQQLTGKAAATIWGRVLVGLNVSERSLKPERLTGVSVEKLRSFGLSNAKAKSILDLSEKCLDGTLPLMSKLRKMTDSEVIESLTQVKGIGPWTAEMFLMFTLGREDVLSVGDLGLRKGATLIYKKKELIEADEFIKMANKWRPYRSVASWYLWRALEI